MKKLLNDHRLLITITLACITVGAFYISFAPATYISNSQIAIFRPKIENPDMGSEDSRNRWVWLRDGLNQKSALLTDSTLQKIISINPTAAEISKKYNNEQATMNHLRSMINIQYTGADEYNFIIEVKASTPQLAFDLNSLIFDRVKYLAVDSYQEKFDHIIEKLKLKQDELKDERETVGFYQDKIKKMIFTHTIEQKQREDNFEIISKPLINNMPVKTNGKLIILISSFIGIILGLFAEYLIATTSRKK